MHLNDMSYLTILTLISLSVPSIATLINSVMLNLIYVDILQTDRWLNKWFFDDNQITELDKPLNAYFEANGFSSLAFITSVGSTSVYLAILLLVYLTILASRVLRCSK